MDFYFLIKYLLLLCSMLCFGRIIIQLSFYYAARLNTQAPKLSTITHHLNTSILLEILLSHQIGKTLTQTLSPHIETLVDDICERRYRQFWQQAPLFYKKKVYRKMLKALPRLVDNALDELRYTLNHKATLSTLFKSFTTSRTPNTDTDCRPAYWQQSQPQRHSINKQVFRNTLCFSLVGLFLLSRFESLNSVSSALVFIILSITPMILHAINQGYQKLVATDSAHRIILNELKTLPFNAWIELLSACLNEKLLTVNELISQYTPPRKYRETSEYLTHACQNPVLQQEIKSLIQSSIQTQLQNLPNSDKMVLFDHLWRPYYQNILKVSLRLSLSVSFFILFLQPG